MPSLSWKKAKAAKAISRFVVDRLQSSSKHGGSLVVETGFPTSVVDLFVKNRDRFKKPPPSSRIKKISKSSSTKTPTPLDLIPVSANPPPSSPTPLLFSPDSRIPLPPTVVQPEGDGVCQGDCDSTMLFLAMLKMFFVVLLAFATSKFVVGITLSAFLLVFMEYAGKHLCRLFFSSSKPKPKSKSSSSSSDDDESSPQCMCMINKTLSSLSFHKSFHCFMGFLGIKSNLFSPQHQEQEEEEDFKAPPCHQEQQDTKTAAPPPHEHTTTTREYSNNNNNDEIETETLVPNLMPRPLRRIPCVASEPDLINWANREQLAAAEEEEERSNVVFHKEAAAYTSCDDFSESSSSSDLKKRKSRRGKIKSKIKRLVSGNLKNKKRNKASLSSSSGGNNKSTLFSSISLDEDKLNSMMSYSSSNSSSRRRMEHVKVNHQFGAEGDDDHRSMSSSTGGDNGICFSNGCTGTEDAGSSVILREEEVEPTASKTNTRNSSSAACLLFFAMVLVGLVGGRTLAIAFTLSWFLLLKSCGILKCWKNNV